MKMVLLAAVAAACFSTQTLAQVATASTTPGGSNSSGTGEGLDEITVTARRRDESLYKVPISIDALSSESIQREGIRSEGDLQSAVPGLLIQQAGSNNLIFYAIRGQSIDQFTSSPPAVLPYFNEFQVDGGSATSFFDLANVQVLKGPQGTLFGRNTTGGAVLYTSVQPGDEFTGYVYSRIANFSESQFQFGVTLPISPVVSLRLAGNYSDGGAYVRNLGSYSGVGGVGGAFVPASNMLGNDENKSYRATLLVKPASEVTSTTTLQVSDDNGTSIPGFLYSFNPASLAGPFVAGQAPPFAGLQQYLAWQRQTNTETYTNSDWAFRNRSFFATNTTDITFANQFVIKNIIGYNHFNRMYSFDTDGTPWHVFEVSDQAPADHDIHKQFSEELQLQGRVLDDALQFTTGVYYSYLRDTQDDLLEIYGAIPSVTNFSSLDRSYAGFLQGTYNLTDALHLTGGVRYTKDDTTGEVLPASQFYGLPAPFVNHQFVSAKKPSWNVSLDYQIDPALLVYVTQRGSWRAGGFNFAAPPINGLASVGGNQFLPETTRDVEGGAKFNSRVAGIPVSATFAVYRQWVDNVQRANFLIFNGIPTLVTSNIPKEQVTGEELNLTVKPAAWLSVGGQLSHLHAVFTDANVAAEGTFATYGPVGFTPDWSGSMFFELSTPVSAASAIVLRGDLYSQSSFYFSNEANTALPNTQIAGYALVNGNLSWNNIKDSGVTISAYAKNMLDRRYYAGGVAQALATGTNIVTPGRPRNYGVELKYAF